MRPVVRLASLAVLGLGMLAPTFASAGPIRIHDPFHESGRFTVQNLRLAGQGHSLVVERGGRIPATLELNHHCPSCGGAINQVIVGLAGEPAAQVCVFNGGGRPTGWNTVRFELDVPDVPGVYEVRVRYAQARSCREAPAWWRTDRPDGPPRRSTIGVIVVEGPPPPPQRTTAEIVPDIDRALDALHRAHQTLRDLTSRPANAKRMRHINELTERAHAVGGELDALMGELKDAMRRGDRVERRDPRPRPARPEFVHVHEPVVPPPLTPADFGALLRRIDQATFPNAQINAIKDELNASAYFLTGQAVAVLGKFPHETHKVEVAALLCPYIIEPAALPQLLAEFTFESYRNQLRQRTGNVCGWQP